jgi:glycerate dehydrogenase
MRLVILDGHALNPGDLDWAPLRALGECRIYDRSDEDKVLERAGRAEILLTNKVPFPKERLEKLPRLRFIAVLATGYDVVDASAAGALGIPVSNVPSYGTDSVAQMVFAHLLNLATRVSDASHGASAGRWTSSGQWSFQEHPQLELSSRVMGIVGFGRIGRATARIARAFGMKVLAVDRGPLEEAEGIEQVTLEELFRKSDAVSLHCPLTEETRGLISRETLRLMKRTAFLINTSRGALVDESALAEALRTGEIAGAGLDVLSQEPPPADHPLLHTPHCFVTPHIAWATKAARQRLLDEVVENVRAFLSGTPRNVVNRVTALRR